MLWIHIKHAWAVSEYFLLMRRSQSLRSERSGLWAASSQATPLSSPTWLHWHGMWSTLSGKSREASSPAWCVTRPTAPWWISVLLPLTYSLSPYRSSLHATQSWVSIWMTLIPTVHTHAVCWICFINKNVMISSIQHMYVVFSGVGSWNPLETVGRQRSSSDPPNPTSPESNVYGKWLASF